MVKKYFYSLNGQTVLVFAVVFILLSLGVWGTEVTQINIRFALMTQDMAAHPIGCFPTINGGPYADYLSTYVVFSYLASMGGRWVNMWTLALPTLLLGAYIFALTYRFGERIKCRLGLCAVVFLALTVEFVWLCREFNIDIPVAAAVLTVQYLLFRADRLGGKRHNLLILLLLMFAFAIRGPLGLAVAGAALAGYLISASAWKRMIGWGVTGALLAVLCFGGVIGLIWLQGGRELLECAWKWQVSSRFAASNTFFWYYFADAFGSFAPVYPVAAAVLAFNWRKLDLRRAAGDDRTAFLRLLLFWILVPLLLLSPAGSRHLRYMALVLPALALAAGYGVVFVSEYRFGVWLERLLGLAARFAAVVLPAGVALFAAVAALVPPLRGGFPWPGGLVVAVLTMVVYWRFKVSDGNELFRNLAGTGVGMLLLTGVVLMPAAAIKQGSAAFVAEVEAARSGELYFCNINPDHDDLKYIWNCPVERRGGIYYLSDAPGKFAGVWAQMYPWRGDSAAVFQVPAGAVVLARTGEYNRLAESPGFAAAFTKIADGEMGNRLFTAFKRR